MSKLVLHCSISLDGFATGPHGDLTRLHEWMSASRPPADAAVVEDLNTAFHISGAIVFGRRTWDSGQQPWGDDDVFSAPVFVLTHDAREPVARNGTVFTFVNGIDEAVRKASDAAGDRNVALMGSPDVAQQALSAGLVDELVLHLVPVLLGAGTPLFPTFDDTPVELEILGISHSSVVTGLRYRVLPKQTHSTHRLTNDAGDHALR
ncbi:MAG: dihydrofolate reductase family protein [Actinomycetota bacterium]|nr:dihydrofolate reductase family protein [Actinomycetota bacterium]